MEFNRNELMGKWGLKLSIEDREFLLSSEKPPPCNSRKNNSELESWICVLSVKLQELLSSAKHQEWPFLPSYVHPDWLTSFNTKVSNVQESCILLKCLLVAMEANTFVEVAAIMFVLDRFMYMYGGANSVIEVVDKLYSCSPDTAIAPQLGIRRARVLKDRGDLHGAMRALDQVISADENCTDAGSWNYKNKAQYDNVHAVCIQIKGQILHNLGLWSEAVPLLMLSVIEFENLPVKDKKGISSSQGLLGKCLKKLTLVEYNSCRSQYSNFTQPHPCHEAYNQAVSAATMCPSQSLFKARHMLEAGDSLLRFAVQQNRELRPDVLYKALQQFRLSISQHDMEALRSREQSYEFVKALYLSSVCLMFSPVQTDVHLAWILEELCIALCTIYCADPLSGLSYNEVAKQIMNLASVFLMCPKLEITANTESLPVPIQDLSLTGLERTTEKNLQFFKTGKEATENKGDTDGPLVYSGGDHLGGRQPSDKINNTDLESHDSVQDQAKEAGDAESLAEQRYVGLPADPRSSMFTSVSPELFSNFSSEDLHEDPPQVDDGATTCLSIQSLPPAQVDSSATTMCSTYTIDALGSLEAMSCTSSSSEDSATNSSVEVLHDEIDFRLPAGSWKPDEQWNINIKNAIIEQYSKYTREVQDIVQSNFNNICNKSGAARGRLWEYDPSNKKWSPQSTLVYVGNKVELKKGKEGAHRDAIHVEFLHQDEPLGKYVGKRYQKSDKGLEDYLQDVKCQMTARYYVTVFNQKLQENNTEGKIVSQIHYLPAAHLQVLSPHGQIVDMLNIEPYLTGDSEFIKLTNNDAFFHRGVNRHILDTGLAFTHFTFEASQRQSMVVDLQGWMPKGDAGVLYLTDPQFNSTGGTKSSPFDRRETGMITFWKTVHPQCNYICEMLELERPKEM